VERENINTPEKLGKLYELSFLKKAFELFPVKEVFKEAVKERITKLTAALEGRGVSREFLEKFTLTGEVSFELYYQFIKSSLYSRLGHLTPIAIEEKVLAKLTEGELPEPLFWSNADFIAWLRGERGEKLALFLELTTVKTTSSFHHFFLGNPDEALKKAYKNGIRLPVNYLNLSLTGFAREVVAALKGVNPFAVLANEIEAIKFVQVLGYALSYSLYSPSPLKDSYCFLGVVSPLYENPSGLFRFDGSPEELEELLESLKAYYGRKKSLNYFFNSPKELLKEVTTTKTYSKELGSIEKVRNKVKEIVFSSKRGEAVFLLHPAGAGKTTQALNLAEELRKTGKEVLFIYFAPRKAIVEEKIQEFKKIGGEVLSSQREVKGGRSFGGYGGVGYATGRLAAAYTEFILRKEANLPMPLLGLFSTLQAIARTPFSTTVKHIEKLVKEWLELYPKGEVIGVIDEITGSEGGFPALFDLAQALKDKNARLFILDANLLCSKVLKAYLNWIENFSGGNGQKKVPAPELLVKINEGELISSLSDRFTFNKLNGFNCVAESYPAFIGESLTLCKEAYFLGSQRKEVIEGATEVLLELLLKEGRKTFLYAQDKKILESLFNLLKERGKSVALITSATPACEIKNSDYVLATSAASRGIDVPVDKAILVIPSFSPEVQLAELYQAVSRIRKGGKEGAKKVKLIWIGREESETEIFRAARILNKAEELLLSYALKPKELQRRFVALPPVEEHRGDGGSILSTLREINELTEVNVSYSAQVHLSVDFNSDKYQICYPFLIYNRMPATITVPVNLLIKAKKVLKSKVEEKKIKADKAKELIELLNELIEKKGCVRDRLTIAVHGVISRAFKEKLIGKSWQGKSLNLILGEWVGFSGTIVGSGLLGFLLRNRKTSCYGGIPRIPLEILD